MARFADEIYTDDKAIRCNPSTTYYDMICEDVEFRDLLGDDIIRELDCCDDMNLYDFTLILRDDDDHDNYEIITLMVSNDVEDKIKEIINEHYRYVAYIYYKGKHIDYDIKLNLE